MYMYDVCHTCMSCMYIHTFIQVAVIIIHICVCTCMYMSCIYMHVCICHVLYVPVHRYQYRTVFQFFCFFGNSSAKSIFKILAQNNRNFSAYFFQGNRTRIIQMSSSSFSSKIFKLPNYPGKAPQGGAAILNRVKNRQIIYIEIRLVFTRISNLFGFQSQLTQIAKIEVVRFWIGLIPLFIDWPQHCEEPYYTLRTPKWANIASGY